MNSLHIACAQLSAAAYEEGVQVRNQIEAIATATQLPGVLGHTVYSGISGFEAKAFEYDSKIIIAYTGTNPDQKSDLLTNAFLALGGTHPQLNQAAEFYLAIKNDPAYAGKEIVFTGHSLGGGLAAVRGEMASNAEASNDIHRAPGARTVGDEANVLCGAVIGADTGVVWQDATGQATISLSGNTIDAGGGNDYVEAGTGADVVHGGTGDDDIAGLHGADLLFGDDGDDSLPLGCEVNTIRGGDVRSPLWRQRALAMTPIAARRLVRRRRMHQPHRLPSARTSLCPFGLITKRKVLL